MTNWDLSTVQAGVNDRHCMCRKLGQAWPVRRSLMPDGGPADWPVVDGSCQQLADRLVAQFVDKSNKNLRRCCIYISIHPLNTN